MAANPNKDGKDNGAGYPNGDIAANTANTVAGAANYIPDTRVGQGSLGQGIDSATGSHTNNENDNSNRNGSGSESNNSASPKPPSPSPTIDAVSTIGGLIPTPTDDFPASNTPTIDSSSTSSTIALPTDTTSSGSGSDNSGGGGGGLSPKIKAAIAVPVAVVGAALLAAAIFLILFLYKRKQRKQDQTQPLTTLRAEMAPAAVPGATMGWDATSTRHDPAPHCSAADPSAVAASSALRSGSNHEADATTAAATGIGLAMSPEPHSPPISPGPGNARSTHSRTQSPFDDPVPDDAFDRFSDISRVSGQHRPGGDGDGGGDGIRSARSSVSSIDEHRR